LTRQFKEGEFDNVSLDWYFRMNYPGLKPWVSQVKDLKCLRFAPGGHSSPSLKARGFLAGFINKPIIQEFKTDGSFSSLGKTRAEMIS